jgi:hypothetical protein
MTNPFSILKRKNKKRIAPEYKDQLLINQGREEFKKLIEKGLELPVVLL